MRKLDDAPTPILFGMIALGFLLLFSNVWIVESATARIVISGLGIFLAIYGWLIFRKRIGPSDPR